MPEVEGYRYAEAEFTREGALHPQGRAGEILGLLREAPQPTDLLVLSHGWNNDTEDARALYRRLLGNLRQLGGGPARGGRALAVLGLLWPSKKFADESVIPGGGIASAGGPDAELLAAKLDRLKETLPPERAVLLEEAKSALGELEGRRGARELFVDRLRRALDRDPAAEPDAADQFFGQDPEELFAGLEVPILLQAPPGEDGGGAGGVGDLGGGTDDGGAAGLAEFASGIAAAANRLLNYATYYQMKARAGVVGQGLAGLLEQIRRERPELRLHLAGHSFGARVVTAAALACATSVRPASLTLLQGAFSHNGFSGGFPFGGATNQGFFRAVVTERKIDGPIVVTHTANDRAVGVAYAIASRLAQQANADLGDAADVFGGIGRNGAVHTAESEAGNLLPPGERYSFRAGTVHNLRADRFVADHGDVTNPAVANALLGAIGWPA
jgi:pimeloyl-ACP methyl ester carboxylesterase